MGLKWILLLGAPNATGRWENVYIMNMESIYTRKNWDEAAVCGDPRGRQRWHWDEWPDRPRCKRGSQGGRQSTSRSGWEGECNMRWHYLSTSDMLYKYRLRSLRDAAIKLSATGGWVSFLPPRPPQAASRKRTYFTCLCSCFDTNLRAQNLRSESDHVMESQPVNRVEHLHSWRTRFCGLCISSS